MCPGSTATRCWCLVDGRWCELSTWRGLGLPRRVRCRSSSVHKGAPCDHRLGRRRHRLGGGRQGHPLEGGRRGGHPLQSRGRRGRREDATAATRCIPPHNASGATRPRMAPSRSSRPGPVATAHGPPKHLTWEESACYTLTLATAYPMLFGHEPHDLKPGQNVLGLGARRGASGPMRSSSSTPPAPMPSG